MTRYTYGFLAALMIVKLIVRQYLVAFSTSHRLGLHTRYANPLHIRTFQDSPALLTCGTASVFALMILMKISPWLNYLALSALAHFTQCTTPEIEI